MSRPKKITDNQLVSNWLIEHRWANTLNTETKHQLPSFVEEAVMAAVYIVAGTSNGRVNISPKLVKKAMMLHTISVDSVKVLELGYDLSDRQAQRLAQTARFALDGITHRIQEFENNLSEEFKMNRKLEWGFVMDYYNQRQSNLYTNPAFRPSVPESIIMLYKQGKYLEYGEAVREFRQNSLPSEYITEFKEVHL